MLILCVWIFPWLIFVWFSGTSSPPPWDWLVSCLVDWGGHCSSILVGAVERRRRKQQNDATLRRNYPKALMQVNLSFAFTRGSKPVSEGREAWVSARKRKDKKDRLSIHRNWFETSWLQYTYQRTTTSAHPTTIILKSMAWRHARKKFNASPSGRGAPAVLNA